MIFLAVHNGQPKELPLDEAIRAFIDHRIDVVRRRTAFLLGKAREREHTLLGLQIALDHLDQVIRIIRQSTSRADARENLFAFFSNRRINLRGTEIAGVTLDPAKYGIDLTGGSVSAQLAPTTAAAGTLILSYRQIDAILELQLYRLTQLSIDELLNELRAVRDNIAEFESILASEKKLRRVIIKELEDIREQATATPAAPSSSTRPTSSPSKTSSPTSRSPSPSPTPATSSARPSPSTASSAAAAPAAWA